MYFAKMCGTPDANCFQCLGEVLIRLDSNQAVLHERCLTLEAQVKELERQRRVGA